MLKKSFLFFVFLAILEVSFVKHTHAQDVSVNFFYNQLAPYGQWVQLDPYGSVWQPYNVAPGWKPYSDGYWVYTDYGWTYHADNEWGWAVYHYGRWKFSDYYGWVWVPGTVWGPAWVAWRHNDQYIGWAPLPPEAVWSEEMSFRAGNFDIEAGIHWSHWSFVEQAHFTEHFLSPFIQITARNVTIVNRTRNITNYSVMNHRIINNSIDVNEYERVNNKRVARYNVVEANSYHDAGFSRANDQQINIYRPAVSPRRTETIETREVINNRNETNDQINQRHADERQQHNDHYDKSYNELTQIHDNETQNSTSSKEELLQQHNAELRAFNEQRSRDAKVLDNRHQMELNRNQQNVKRVENNNEQNTRDERK